MGRSPSAMAERYGFALPEPWSTERQGPFPPRGLIPLDDCPRYERPYSYAAHWARRHRPHRLIVFSAVAACRYRFRVLDDAALSGVVPLIAGAWLSLASCWQRSGSRVFGRWHESAVRFRLGALPTRPVPARVLRYGAVQYLTRPGALRGQVPILDAPPWISGRRHRGESWLGASVA